MSGRLSISPLWRAIKLTGLRPAKLFWAVLAGSLTLGASVALAGVSAWLILRASQMPSVTALSVAVVGVRTFGISRALFRYLERLASHRVALDGMTELRVRLFDKLAAGRATAAALLRRGDMLARVGADVDDVGDLVVRGIIPGLVAVVLIIGTSGAVAAFLPGAGVVLACCLLFAGIAGPLLTWRAARIAELRATAARARVSATALTVLDHASELAVGGTMPRTVRELQAGENQLFDATERSARPLALAAGLSNLAMGVAVVAAFLLGIPALASGSLAEVELAVIVLLPLAAFEAVNGLPAAAQQVYKSRAAAIRIMELIDSAASDDADSQGDGAQDDAQHSPVVVPPEAALIARDVTCAWPTGPAVVSGISLTLAPGQAIGIVGPSGVGKTTLLATLSGLLEPRAGQMLIGPYALSALSRDQAAETVAFIAEDAHVFETTVLENLRVVRGDITPEAAREALEVAGLTAWLKALPDGLETVLGGDGTTVSGGERRRLLFARALLSPARYILLDEPGEHLDPSGADRLTTEILATAARTGRGVIIVTHRLSALGNADEIIVLDDHSVAARGTHAELLETSAHYRWLVGREDVED